MLRTETDNTPKIVDVFCYSFNKHIFFGGGHKVTAVDAAHVVGQ